MPRFAALQSSKVNLRAGPGETYPVQWVYQRAGLPVEIIEEFDVWRKIRDHDGITGWVRGTLLTGKRHAIVMGQQRTLRREAEETSRIVALLEAGVIARILECGEIWCRLEVQGYKGWLRKDEIWGVYPTEIIEP